MRFNELVNLIREIDSSNVPKKKSIEQLREVLNDEEVVHALIKHSETSRNDVVNWDCVYSTLHHALLKIEDGRRRKETSALCNLSLQCASFISSIVKQSCFGVPFIKVSTIIRSFLEILSVPSMRQNVGYAYVDVLKFVLLSHRKCRSEVTHEQWKDLFRSLLLLYKNSSSLHRLEPSLIVEILNIVVLHGSCQSDLSLHVKELFPLIQTAFQNDEFYRNKTLFQERLIQLTVTLCSQTAKESRAEVCRFGEEIICPLICVYDKLSVKGKCLLVDLLLMQLHAHHPRGSVESTYTFDTRQWSECLKSIYSLIVAEFDRSFDRKIKRPPQFTNLAVEILKQVFENSSTILNHYEEGAQSSKKKKYDVGVMFIASPVLSAVDSPLSWSRISVIDALIAQYPKCLCEEDFVPLLELMADLQSNCKNDILMKHICLCCTSLLKAEQELKKDKETTSLLWDKIWETTIRTVGLNQIEEESHLLLQALVYHGKAKNLSELTNMFLLNTFHATPSTVQTLNILLSKYDLSSLTLNVASVPDHKMLRKNLLGWLLSEHTNEINVDVKSSAVAEVLVQLSSKTVHFQRHFEKSSAEVSSFDFMLREIEEVYTISSFEYLWNEEKDASESTQNFSVDIQVWNYIQELLIKKCETWSEAIVQKDVNVNLKTAFYELSLLIDVWVSYDTVCPQNPLFLETMDLLIKYLSSQVEYHLSNDENSPNMFLDIFLQFQSFILKKYPSKIKHWLFNALYSNMVECLIKCVTEDPSSHSVKSDLEMDGVLYNGKNEEICASVLDECFRIENGDFLQVETKCLYGKEKLREECLKMLGCICTLGEEEEDSRKMSEIAFNLLNNVPLDMKIFNAMVWFIQCLIKNITLNEFIIASVLNTLKSLFSEAGYDCHTTFIILSLLQGMTLHVHDRGSGQEKRNFLALIGGFQKGIRMNKFGFRVTVKLIRCLETIAKVDSSASWSNIQGSPAVENILSFLDSPFHEVRLTAILCLKTVYSQCFGHTDISWHFKLFKMMSEKIDNSFIIEGNLSPSAAIDEAANRTASALLAFIVALVSSPVLHEVSLLGILKFSCHKNLDVGLFKRALLNVCTPKKVSLSSLALRSLPFLVRSWLEKKLSLQDLAKYLCQSSLSSFYSNYLDILIPIFLVQENKKNVTEISELTKMNVVELYEVCFPKIMSELLPGLQANNSTALKCHKELEKVLSVEGVVMFLSSKLPKVIVGIIKKIYDPDHFVKLTGVHHLLPSKDPYCISFETAMECLKYLQISSPAPDINLLEFLSDNTPSHVQIILLDLAINITEAIFLQDKLISFYQYCVFASLVVTDMRKNSALAPHIICCVIHRIAFLIEESLLVETTLSISACNFLKYFCDLCLPNFSDILSTLLNLIVNALVPAVKLKTKLSSAAISVLKYIFFEKREYFTEQLFLVSPFPQDSIFEEYQNIIDHVKSCKKLTLEDEISNFLQMHHQTGSHCMESVKHIRQKLADCQDELKQMFQNLYCSSGFSEETSKSLLHRLIIVLIELATSSVLEVRYEAGRCLGEIGPTDLGTLVLRPDVCVPVRCVADIVPLVAESLLNKNINVVKAASSAMYSLLKFKECFEVSGNELMNCGISTSGFLYPFSVRKKCPTLTFQTDEEVSIIQFNDENLWCFSEGGNHETWVINLTCTVLAYICKGNNFIQSLIPLCKEKASFSENILPFFISKLASSNSEIFCIIKQHIQKFFENHVKLLHSQTTEFNSVCLNKASVQCMLNLVYFLRVYGGEEHSRNSKTSDLNYLQIAQAAIFCNAHFSSILYVELWCDVALGKENSEQIYGQSRTPLELICEKRPEDGGIAQKILWDAYQKICHTDAIYGCGWSLLLDSNKRPLHYELRGEWDKVILSHDMQLSSGNTEAARGLVNGLYKAGFQHVLDVYLRSCDNTLCPDIKYNCAWRLAKWDMHDISPFSHLDNFEKHHFMALRALANFDEVGIVDSINEARNCVSESLVNLCLESCKSIYQPLSLFRQIQEIEEFQDKVHSTELEEMLKLWAVRDEMSYNQFEDIEPVLWQRIIMLRSSQKNDVREGAAEIAAKLARLAREEGIRPVATKCIDYFTNSDLSFSIDVMLKMEEARLQWDSGDLSAGKLIMRAMLNNLGSLNIDCQTSVVYAQSLKLFGDWMVETKSENPRVVIEDYYQKALKMLKDVGDTSSENVLDIYSALACFSDGQYQNFSNYCKSRAFEIKKEWIKRAIDDVENMMKQPNRTVDEDRCMVWKRKQSKIDQEEIFNTEREKNKYLSDAIMYYLKCLELGDRNNLDVFRVASLWLENMLDPEVNKILERNLSKVPSYKFVPILPQMTPRISNVKDDFSIKLNKLLVRCAGDHPHHTLPIIMALANSNKDLDFCLVATNKQDRKSEPRVLGAQNLMKELMKSNNIGDLIYNLNNVSCALISLAYLERKNPKGSVEKFSIPENEPLRKLRNVEGVLVPTLNIPVEKNCKYDNIIGISKYETTFSFVGGINAPKKVTCVGTDGVERPQLVKGKDDLRQDAVMQQVFTIMNSLLRKSKHTAKRKLLIRTYKVLPLSRRSGIIEWCENTVPFVHYLVGGDHQSGAHKKYYPEDLPTLKAREMMHKVCRKSNEERLEVFKNICNLVHPVLRYFFLEHFTSPGTWFERRLAYTQSVATSSMIGYILGLGDRHLANILVDQTSAEMIHIDFGIAFEMGLMLPTPETVPFRLTRDIVDGMGSSGVEGVFRKSCERTMTVLREHHNILLTILEVLLYDPLYAWTITPSKAFKMQRRDVKIMDEKDSSSSEVNRMAERALQRLKQKLLGTEVDVGVSVSTQVNRLIQEASDPGNLSRLFIGWESYL